MTRQAVGSTVRWGWPFFITLALLVSCASAHKPEEYSTWTVAQGGGPANLHYSSLTQINCQNVAKLRVAWTYNTHDAFPGSEMECNPIIVDGVLYATTPKLRVIALDAATGKPKWRFSPIHRGIWHKMRNRGVGYWNGGSTGGKRIFAVAGHYLYALDAETGRPIRTFADAGHIDLRRNLGRDPSMLTISDTSPPVVYKNLLIVGSMMAETLPSPPGDIRAYDARTGKLRRSFHTLPHPGEPGYKTWPPDAWRYIGGVNNWAGMSVDTKRGIVFAPLGSPSFDFDGSNRIGNDLYADSLIALNAETGKLIWYFQTVRHDLWDRDLPAAPDLVTVTRHGQRIDAVAQPTKSGFIYLFNREDGKPLFPIGWKNYPKSDIDGEVAAKQQPLPLKPPPFARQILTKNMLTERTPQAHEAALKQFRKVRSDGQFVPPSLQGTIIFPGFDGGADWGGAAVDPKTGWLYVNSNEMAWVSKLDPVKSANQASSGHQLYVAHCATCHQADMKGSPPDFPSLVHISKQLDEGQVESMIRHGGGRMPSFAALPPAQIRAIANWVEYHKNIRVQAAKTNPSPIDQKYRFDGYKRFLDPQGYPAIKPPWGTLNAIDLNTGNIVWKIPFGEYPQLAKQGLRNTGSQNYGGPVVTASGLLFIGATNYDKKFHAFDAHTGKLLWEATLPFAGNATPAVYQVNG
ncbi:MAG: PQQ-binding-like beta-propeller repeat protein, partial [Candidatus Acidiferrales bacterium]